MDVHISFNLAEHGWSYCWIDIAGQPHHICITHALLPNPIEDCLISLMGIMKGDLERTFFWHDEPGGVQIRLTTVPKQLHLLRFKVSSFAESYHKPIKEMKEEVDFEIPKQQLIRIFYFEFKKIVELHRNPAYQKNRNHQFPFQQFRAFEKLAVEYIDLAKLGRYS